MFAMRQEQLLFWLWDKNNFYVGYGTRATSMLVMGQEQLLCCEEETSHINFGEHVLIYSLCLFLVTLETYNCTTATSTVVNQDQSSKRP